MNQSTFYSRKKLNSATPLCADITGNSFITSKVIKKDSENHQLITLISPEKRNWENKQLLLDKMMLQSKT